MHDKGVIRPMANGVDSIPAISETEANGDNAALEPLHRNAMAQEDMIAFGRAQCYNLTAGARRPVHRGT
jgi:hypothetical protein